jgi:hypothetical protein
VRAPAPTPSEQDPLPDPSLAPTAADHIIDADEMSSDSDDTLADSASESTDSADDIVEGDEIVDDDEIVQDDEIVEDGEEILDEGEIVEAEEPENEDEPEETKAPAGMLDCNHWVIKGLKGGILQNMFNCKLEYKILNGQTKKKVGTALELTGGMDALRFLVGVSQATMPSTIEVRDKYGDKVFSVEKDARFNPFKGVSAKIMDGDRALVGKIQGKGVFTQLTKFVVLDCDDREIGNIQVSWRPWQLVFRSKKGKLLGKTKAGGSLVSGNAKGWRWFPRGSVFILDGTEAIEKSEERKMLLLAAPLVYDLGVYDMFYRSKR